MLEPLFYTIAPDVPTSYYQKLFNFIHEQYFLPQREKFSNITLEATQENCSLSYTVTSSGGNEILEVKVRSGNPFELQVTPVDPSASPTNMEEAKQDVLIAIQMFAQNTKNSTMYLAWREGEEVRPENYSKPKKSFNRFFFETQILFFAVFVVLGTSIFLIMATAFSSLLLIAPLILIGVQFIFIFYSNRFIARAADWHITENNPTIHFLEYYHPISQKNDPSKTYPREVVTAIKREIYNDIVSKGGQVDLQAAQQTFLKHGVPCELENLKTKKINVHELVKGVADRFHVKMPKIVVSNTRVPNAAASGPIPSRGLVLITTGLLVQLQEDELRGVLGHEFGHLKGRDPLVLYGLVSAEFLFRFYVLFPLFPLVFSTLLFLPYFWGVMVLIFFIAKFFEARADLLSAMLIGKPQVLAGSLEKIGFQRLLYERTHSYRVQEWLGLDPHPPIYFRVNRLANLSTGEVKHPLIQSIKDVARGFTATLKS